MTSTIMLADLHQSNKDIDSYRSDLEHQVLSMLQEYRPQTLHILGDLCENKDFHSAQLVNRVVDMLVRWSNYVDEVILLAGNHDGIDPNCPYFRFLRHIPRVRYITEITQEINTLGPVTYLPHTRNPLQDWAHLVLDDQIVFAHVTVAGASTDTGARKLESEVPAEYFHRTRRTFSGDVHTPHEVGKVFYVGAPYAVRFGDAFSHIAGCTWWNGWDGVEPKRIAFKFLQRLMLDVDSYHSFVQQVKDETYSQIKVRLHINQDNMGQWEHIKEEIYGYCERVSHLELIGFELISELTDSTIESTPVRQITLEDYCERHQIGSRLTSLGKAIASS